MSPIEGVKSEKVEPRPRSSGLKEGDVRPRGPWVVTMLVIRVNITHNIDDFGDDFNHNLGNY